MEKDELNWNKFVYGFHRLPIHLQIKYYLLFLFIDYFWEYEEGSKRMSHKAIAINVVTVITLVLIAALTDNQLIDWIAGMVTGAVVVGSILFWVVKDFLFNNNK